MKRMILWVRNFLFLTVLFIVPYVYAMFQGGFVSWFLFFSVLPIIIYLLGIWIYPIQSWSLARKVSKKSLQAGDEVEITVKIKRKIPFPLHYCVIEEIIPPSLQKIDPSFEKYAFLNDPEQLQVKRQMKKMIFPWWKRNFTLQYKLKQMPRGEHHLSSIRIKTGDFFGFIKKVARFKVENHLFVYPNQWEITANQKASYHRQHPETARFWHAKQTNMAVGVREYVLGDKPAWIHWKQAARKNMLMTKEFEREEETNTYVVLDRRRGAVFNEVAFDGSVDLAYSWVQYLIKQRMTSEFISIGAEIRRFSISVRGKSRQMIDHHFMKAQASGSITSSEWIEEISAKVNRNAQLIIISAELTRQLSEQILQVATYRENIDVYSLQAKIAQTDQTAQSIAQFQRQGISVQLLSAEQLTKKTLEVKM